MNGTTELPETDTSNLVSITVDEVDVRVDPAMNLIDALKKVHIDVAHFCYHPKLEVVGMCRMCLIEIEGVPRFQPACNTPVKEGMKIRVNSEKVRAARAGVMEFLLINHPLDCPVCDKAGECSLQNYSFAVGQAGTRYEEKKRNIPQEKIGTNLQINHNRCILCYRCVRFDKDVVGVHDLEFAARGNDTVIAYVPPEPGKTLLDHNYQGALADICPVGALLNEETMFRSRVWWYQQEQTICHGCNTLCHVTSNVRENSVYRYMPPQDPETNGYFICDHGRFHTDEFSTGRLLSWRKTGSVVKSADAISEIRDWMASLDSLLILGGSTESTEDLQTIRGLIDSERQGRRTVWEARTTSVHWEEMPDPDFLMSADLRPNHREARRLAESPYSSIGDVRKELHSFQGILVLNELAAPYHFTHGASQIQNQPFVFLEDCMRAADKVLILNTHDTAEVNAFHYAAPVRAFPEKNGSYLNKNGEVRQAKAVLRPAQNLLSSSQVLQALLGRTG